MNTYHRILCSALALVVSGPIASTAAFAWQAEKITDGLVIPWGLAYVNDKSMLVTEKAGVIKHVDLKTGDQNTLFRLPNVWAKGQGGLLDIALSPFENGKFYVTYSKGVDGEGVTTLASANYSNNKVTHWTDVFVSKSRTDTGRHFGSRITFDDSHLYFSIGDRGDRDNGQDTMTHAGSILRLNADGSTPSDNPFINNDKVLDEIWSFGHRNPQGLFYDFPSQKLWSIEHGPRGGDEINLIKAGANYGWPVTSHGKEYWGPISVGESETKEGIEAPKKVYVPSIAPGSLIVYQGNKYPELQGKLLAGALKLTHINIVTVNGQGEAIEEERILEDLGERIRDIETSPNGDIFFSTDNGNLYRLKK
ncbi:PQQ-dependent sugar dehydrogenase [Vibrio crassostreae]|uniref:Soluble quinoprotein glucose/sorbosone dehydrogenase n=1 Tax=Vibrio crassostreae TaxID=246167 RepID=A0ABP1WVN9_9VIBR|nr:PQQ-dependent sugar dehydrogenase [Vibrio crassostreae]TCL28848.1 glucose/arabinose dehydrogenase [Vibrio crassostreae]TCT51616.1 glucose/arabinose dehydrogenase [Vibrio crassostreae]TCT60933.1 glucose/arabinose dehydrogenase [Vibrio crassostreae]CAK1721009.1 aldose sugar dehydrogenase [Vibrio crassostreae]CAK1734532.1 aldose sugar dehydrogenase [Vibrio crassostreae]